MKVGVFTALLSQLPLNEVLKKLKALQIDTVELGTGNYPGDAHCNLSLLENSSALTEFKSTLAGHGVSISALSCHGNALHPDARPGTTDPRGEPEDDFAGRKTGCPGCGGFLRMSWRFAFVHRTQLGHLSLASRLSRRFGMAME